MSEAITLTEASADLVARKTAAYILGASGSLGASDAMLTRGEAMQYVKRRCQDSFQRWKKRWAVKARSHGRYSRADLDLALARESGQVRTPRSLARKLAGMTADGRAA